MNDSWSDWNADKIFVMVDGRIVEQGTYAELTSKEGGAFARLDESYWRGQSDQQE